jgi:hypothetical protein
MVTFEQRQNRFVETGSITEYIEITEQPTFKYKQLDVVYVNSQIGILKFYITNREFLFTFNHLQPLYRGYHLICNDSNEEHITGEIISYTENEIIGLVNGHRFGENK